jgi:hypothetical protein
MEEEGGRGKIKEKRGEEGGRRNEEGGRREERRRLTYSYSSFAFSAHDLIT